VVAGVTSRRFRAAIAAFIIALLAECLPRKRAANLANRVCETLHLALGELGGLQKVETRIGAQHRERLVFRHGP